MLMMRFNAIVRKGFLQSRLTDRETRQQSARTQPRLLSTPNTPAAPGALQREKDATSFAFMKHDYNGALLPPSGQE